MFACPDFEFFRKSVHVHLGTKPIKTVYGFFCRVGFDLMILNTLP